MLQQARNELTSEEAQRGLGEGVFNEEAPVEQVAEEPKKKPTGGRPKKKARKQAARPATEAMLEIMGKRPAKRWSVAELAKRTKTGKPATSMRLRKCLKDGTVTRAAPGLYRLVTGGTD